MKGKVLFACFCAALALLGLSIFFLARLSYENRALSVELERERELSRIREARNNDTFLDGTKSAVFKGEQEYAARKEYLRETKVDFIEVDLTEMRLRIFKEGEERESLAVRTKGREGSWWETPTGEYTAISKSAQHFSSIGNVWMPWSIQFYGNFFIHGWPSYSDGKPVPESFSGGCIRLSTEDARKVYEFAKKGTPILIHEREAPFSVSVLTPIRETAPPEVSSQAFLVADMDTGEVLFNKRADSEMPVASLTKLMTAVVGSEVVYLERDIVIRSSMLRDSVQSFPLEVGKRYMAFDLYYPLLMQSSNGAARALAAFVGEGEFVKQMNEKARVLGMERTTFTDPSGVDDGNASTLKDIAKLMKYIMEKRYFIFDISKGKKLSVFSGGELSRIENFNEFSGDERLAGMKNGYTSSAGETIATLWVLRGKDEDIHRVFIGGLDSAGRAGDVKEALSWLEETYGLK